MGSCVRIGLLDDVVSSYDQTKTTIYGRVAEKTYEGTDVLGAPLSRFIDVFADTGYAPVGPLWLSSNGRLYVQLTAASTGMQVAMYNFNTSTGVYTYVGKICFVLPNNPVSVHIIRGIRVYNDDSENTGDWRMFVLTSSTTTGIINSGLLCVNNIDNNDFIPGNIGALPPTPAIIQSATGTDQKRVYFLQASEALGASHVNFTSAALIFEATTNKIWVHNGLAANHRYISYNAAVASLVLPSYSVNLSAATPCVVTHNSHPFKVNDQVVFFDGTMPHTTLIIGTVYYIRNPGTNTYELSATVGGASIATTGGSPSTATICRAHGQTDSAFINTTPILPTLTGTLLLTDSEYHAVPIDSPISGAILNGQSCAAFTTSTNLYLGKLSELSSNSAYIAGAISVATPGVVTHVGHPFVANEAVMVADAVGVSAAGTAHTYAPPTGLLANTVYYIKNPGLNSYELSLTPGGASIATTANPCYACVIHRASALSWPSLSTSNLLGSSNEITVPAATAASWDNTTDDFTYVTNSARFITKQLINNNIRSAFGVVNNAYYELLTDPRIIFGMASILSVCKYSGWIFTSSSTIGQRGVQFIDASSDDLYETSYIITRVIDAPSSTLIAYKTFEKLYEYTGDTNLYYRTSGFGSETGGWLGPVSTGEALNIAIATQIQFKITFVVQSDQYDSPPQLSEFAFTTDAQYAMSNSWEYSHNNSDSSSPTRVAFRLKSTYSTSVPTLHFRAYDLFDSLLTHFNTTTNPTYFEYSTDSGSNWLPLGTIPNVVGTLVRFTFTSPPGVDVRPSINEI